MSVEQAKQAELRPYQRLAFVYEQEPRAYDPSTSEILLEEICSSFGTVLNEAELDGRHLTRLSNPVILTNRKTEDKYLLQIQYTRFPPLRDTNKLADISQINQGERFKRRVFDRELADLMGQEDAASLLIGDFRLKEVTLGRYEKGFYFSLYRIGVKETVSDDQSPFHVFEPGDRGVGEFRYRRPDLWIHFWRRPAFYCMGREASDPDILRITFPQIYLSHYNSLNSAMTINPTKGITKDQSDFASTEFKVSRSEPIQKTMAFLQSYLKQFATGSTL